MKRKEATYRTNRINKVMDGIRLEDFITGNKARFESEEMPDGHKERFIQKIDTQKITASNNNELLFGRKFMLRFAIPAVCIAIAALFIFKGDNASQPEYLISPEIAKSEVAMEKAYLKQLKKYQKEIVRKNAPYASKEDLENLLNSITEDASSFAMQLPEELSKRERYRILKEYYKEKFDALKVVKNAIADNIGYTEE